VTPGEVQTRETLRFVLESAGAGRPRVLEVGCGGGELARELAALGREVVAVDSSPESVAAARALGVDARVAAFPDFDDETPFDCVLFTRSLHHIRPVAPAVERARQLLRPRGLLVVEDFAFGDASERTARWFHELLRLLDACGALAPAPESFGRRLLEGGGSLALWREHAHEINTAAEVFDAVRARFTISDARPAPYLYRYVAALAPDDARGGRLVSHALELETLSGAGDPDFLLGRRIVARRD
jgi:SAM-dependent methyltransferase